MARRPSRSSTLQRLRTPAIAVGLAAAQLALGLVAGRPSDPDYYRRLKQAPFAPPAWAFGPAWAIAKAGAATTTAIVISDRSVGNRKGILLLAGIDAFLYVSFTYVYFTRRSPRLAAIWTCSNAAVTAGQLALLARDRRRAAIGLAPQAAWLALATPVAVYQTVHNPG